MAITLCEYIVQVEPFSSLSIKEIWQMVNSIEFEQTYLKYFATLRRLSTEEQDKHAQISVHVHQRYYSEYFFLNFRFLVDCNQCYRGEVAIPRNGTSLELNTRFVHEEIRPTDLELTEIYDTLYLMLL